jgi:hypothetical protein
VLRSLQAVDQSTVFPSSDFRCSVIMVIAPRNLQRDWQLKIVLKLDDSDARSSKVLELIPQCHPQQGSAEAAPGSGIMAALHWLPSKMVVRRLLPPSSSASVLPGGVCR